MLACAQRASRPDIDPELTGGGSFGSLDKIVGWKELSPGGQREVVPELPEKEVDPRDVYGACQAPPPIMPRDTWAVVETWSGRLQPCHNTDAANLIRQLERRQKPCNYGDHQRLLVHGGDGLSYLHPNAVIRVHDPRRPGGVYNAVFDRWEELDREIELPTHHYTSETD